MKRATRSQRLKEYRINRYKRAIKTLEGGGFAKSKLSKGNKIVLFVILAVFFLMNFYSISNRNKDFKFSVQEFQNEYTSFVVENLSKFVYDKDIIEVIQNDEEYSFLQKSSAQTSNLIAVYQYRDKVKKIGVIGIPKENDVFRKSYLENMAIILSIVMDKQYNDSLEYLKKSNFLDENYNIIRKEKKIVSIDSGFLISIINMDNSIVFTIEKK